jgi:hypothetical protein
VLVVTPHVRDVERQYTAHLVLMVRLETTKGNNAPPVYF